uniref:DUF3752 domain-containing protein n=1 Tax=Octopus bimaculoides TaxID=37653 RepID=A0A0L8FPF3_OCTBM
MVELPPEIGPGLGLVARTFRQSKSICESKDRSLWTDTPIDQAKKQKEGHEKHGGKRSSTETDQFISERDQRCSKIVDEYNKNRRSESLLNMHTKQRKSAKTIAGSKSKLLYLAFIDPKKDFDRLPCSLI